MWYLKSDTDQRILYVTPHKEITIGRSVDAQVCNFAIPDDASISRKHATLSISENSLYLQDAGSRYGTFVNDERLEGSKVKVNNNDVIKFGKLSSIWTVHEFPFVTCTSTLKGENLQNLRSCLTTLGGVLKNEWDDSCVYLTMPAITLTIKVVLALAQGSHIVTTEFWKKCVEAVNSHAPLPDPGNFTPQVVESTLNKDIVSFLPNAFRKTLFAGKKIIFFSKRQLEMYKLVLTKCSGTPLLLSETNMTKASLCDPSVIVIQCNQSNLSQETKVQIDQINDIIEYLKSKGKRVVADAEIGLAILSCSLDKYCNAEFNYSSEVMKPATSQNKPTKVLVPETQESTQKLQGEHVVINESLTPTNAKRKLSEEDDNGLNANKKFAGQSEPSVESVKRKHDDNNEIANPNKKMAVDTEDDIFNFLSTTKQNSTKNNTENVLGFTKVVQNKTKVPDDDDPFSVINDKIDKISKGTNESAGNRETKESAEMTNGSVAVKQNYAITGQGQKRKLEEDNVDISALRGSKLKELMENQNNMELYKNVKVKKEEPDELDKKMNDLDLGETIITIRKDLIVKKEPVDISEPEYRTQRNFKKFKKVWPVKSHMKTVPKTIMSIVIPDSVADEITSQSY